MEYTVTVRMPRKLKAQLDVLSKEEHVPVSDIVRESLQKYLAIRRFRRLRTKILPFAESQGLLTDEDAFRNIS
ncbi:MAG: ribbon-helix-helix domain-containing protein [Candidatus Aureabacteria bacterium]|nr:ribbon-helix-helix domain-containing protein [Candidatus Auribacterota bacterium]